MSRMNSAQLRSLKSTPTPPPPKPAPKVNTTTLAGVQAASKSSAPTGRVTPPTPAPVAARGGNVTADTAERLINAANRTTSGSTSGSASGAPAPAPPASGGGRGGGGGGGPRSIADFDWFKSDPFFRTAAGGAQSNLVDQLAQLLFEQGQAYQGIDNARRQWGMSRDRSSLDLGENFAARGLNQSGLYMRGLQDMLRDYEESAGQINQSESSIGQQLGQRNSLADLMAAEQAGGQGMGPLRREALFDDNYNALADIYGRLGQRGVTAGNQYQSMLNQMRAQSAGRSNDNIINTLGW